MCISKYSNIDSMKANFRMTVFGFVLLAAYVLSAHPELLEGKYLPKSFGLNATHINANVERSNLFSISEVAYFPLSPEVSSVQNQDGTLRAFLFADRLYVERSFPRTVYMISGNFTPPTSLANVYFSEKATLMIPVMIVGADRGGSVIVRMHLDTGAVEFLPK